MLELDGRKAMPILNFNRMATRTGGELNTNTLHHLKAMQDYLENITLANRLSGHGLTLNSTYEGQQILALVQALARAEQNLLKAMYDLGSVRDSGQRQLPGQRNQPTLPGRTAVKQLPGQGKTQNGFDRITGFIKGKS